MAMLSTELIVFAFYKFQLKGSCATCVTFVVDRCRHLQGVARGVRRHPRGVEGEGQGEDDPNPLPHLRAVRAQLALLGRPRRVELDASDYRVRFCFLLVYR